MLRLNSRLRSSQKKSLDTLMPERPDHDSTVTHHVTPSRSNFRRAPGAPGCPILSRSLRAAPHVIASGHYFQPLFLHQRQQLEGGPLWVLLAPLPLTYQARRHVEVSRKNSLARLLPSPQRANLSGSHFLDRRQAKRVEFAHRPLVNPTRAVQIGSRLMNSR